MRKRNAMCPYCYIKRMFAGTPAEEKREHPVYENVERRTPLMGWSSWNTFKNRIDQKLIYDTAKAMKESGLADAGYEHINLDDNWHSNMRDDNGEWQGDLVTFSEGIPALVDKIHALGLKAGIYSSNGTLTCEDLPASLGRELADARTLAKWKLDYFKYDFCHNIPVSKYAPLVYSIQVSDRGASAVKEYEVSNAILSGYARRRRCGTVPGGQIVSGIDAGGGSITFDNITADKAGEYVLTVNIKKKGRYEKFLAVDVNGEYAAEIEFPSQKHFNNTARFQTIVRLKEGANSVKLYNPVKDSITSAALLYRRMAYALKKATAEQAAATGEPERKILFSICEWGFRKPWLWGASAGNMWRTTGDIRPVWWWIKAIYSRTVKLHKYACAGHFNDPDMLEVGNGKLTYDQNMSHFALWCMMCAPLVLGNDIRNMPKTVFDIVTNRDLIAINQDALAKQAKRVKKGLVDVLAKPLADGSTAICFFNKTGVKRSASYDICALTRDDYVAMPEFGGEIVKIVGDVEADGSNMRVSLPADGVVVFRVR